jgi:transforming growth factor-beta-induced protein
LKSKTFFTGYILFISVAVLTIISACSSSPPTTPAPAGNPSNPNPGASASAAAATAPVSAVLPSDTMFQYFLSNGNLTVFATALYDTNLVAELKGKGSYTVFVPTDEAFLKMPPLQKEAIFKDQAKLKQVMLYHFVQGIYPASKLGGPTPTLKTLEGENLEFKIINYDVTVNGAKYVLTDVPATDGVIHIIDAVLIPPSMASPSPSRTTP